MDLDDKVTRAVRYVSRFTLSEDEARAAIVAVFDWQLTQSRDPVVLHSLAAMRKEALGD